MKKSIFIGILFFAFAALNAADSLDMRLLKISKSLSNASSTNAIKKHFSNYKLSQKELATVYSYYLINNIDYDCNSFISGNIDDISSSDILVQRKAVCYGYSKVFSDLCNSSGIHCYIVKGMSKGFSYTQGKVPVESNHSWNVIKIDSQYHLIDLTWAAGYVAYEGKTLKFIREADPKQ
ncbi:MAG: hypothetical protein IT244_03710, partial [Bacteroidia bacterium]|nr:hypothetical protein [Bacteroidia bacterium]